MDLENDSSTNFLFSNLIKPIEQFPDDLLLPPARLGSHRYIGLGDFKIRPNTINIDVLRMDVTLPTMTIEHTRNLLTGDIEGYQDIPISTTSLDDPSSNRPLSSMNDYFEGAKNGTAYLPGGFEIKEPKEINFEPLILSLNTGTNLLSTPMQSTEVDVAPDEQLPELPEIANFSPTPVPQARSQKISEITKTFAINDDWDTSLFSKEIPNPALSYPYKLDDFQLRAIHRLELGQTVFVSAPTSAGKTAIAQYAIALCRSHKMRAIYTSPIKALSNQKFRDLSRQFGDVGILTGDVSLNRDSSCIIMTTEILRSMLYHGADMLRDVECVIFDECHYIANDERGVVWEECISLLPYHINMVFLSATVPNSMEISDWIGRTKQRIVYVQNHLTRPIPIEHTLYTGDGNFYTIQKPGKKLDHMKIMQAQMSINSDKDYIDVSPEYWITLVLTAENEKLLPILIFCFSQKLCEQLADNISNVNLLTKAEQKHVKGFCRKSLLRLNPEDRELPQIRQLFTLLEYGVAVHHGGILPIMKEVVEILLADGYVKVLFCTTTFGMGLNVPARSCAFVSLKKFNGKANVLLTPTEYVQMSGRAGRRGLDTVGTSIIMCQGSIPCDSYLNSILNGSVEPLQSQFYLKFNMILNLLRVKDIGMTELLRRSLSANLLQSMMPELVKKQQEYEKQLKALPQIQCVLQDIEDMGPYGDNMWQLREINHWMLEQVDTKSMLKQLRKGRVVFIASDKPTLAVIAENPNQAEEIKAISANGTNITFALEDIGVIFAKPPKTVGNLVPANVKKQLEKFNETPVEWTKLLSTSDYEFAQSAKDQIRIYQDLYKSPCMRCTLLNKHLDLYNRKVDLMIGIDEIKSQMHDESLAFKPLLDRHINVLQHLNYLTSENVLMLKGRVSIEINSCNEILGTELLFSGIFDDLNAKEIASVVATLVSEGVNSRDSDLLIPGTISDVFDEIMTITTSLYEVFCKFQIPVDENWIDNNFNMTLAQVVYDWADGQPFKNIMYITNVAEGNVVRIINRVSEALKDFANAAKLIGCNTLSEHFELAGESIKRDIIFASSLYFD